MFFFFIAVFCKREFSATSGESKVVIKTHHIRKMLQRREHASQCSAYAQKDWSKNTSENQNNKMQKTAGFINGFCITTHKLFRLTYP
ncbi:hypothetical protein DC498_07805 [Terrimonas sp.]|nr:hypothetical protein DC498_07805 [Terrimonas sp.]